MLRNEALKNFLNATGWSTAQHISLASDASARTYERLVMGNKTAILMNSPLSEKPEQFVFIDEVLKKAGIHSPDILAQDLNNGFLILEDFGNNTFTALLNQGVAEFDLYQKGIDTLIQMQDRVVLPHGIPLYSHERLMNGVMMLPQWFGKHALENGLSEEAIAEFRDIWQDILSKLEGLPQTLVLLDYHADNLMITPNGDCGVLDFQDACIGPLGYDLMSLLEDERRDVSPAVRNRLIEHYFNCRKVVDTPAVRASLPIVAMQRHTRVIGIFARLFLRDSKEKYLRMIPFVWELIHRHLNESVFQNYKNWIDRYIPERVRTTILTAKDFS
ncbi:MAG: phosphotransferase [Pseudomonadota bacterium]|nr:phosphotransferase [Pseudomonadota bacterium]